MVKEIKAAGHKTGQTVTNVFEVIMLAATVSVAVKAAGSPAVQTTKGNLPLWQIAAALVLAGVAYKLYTLQSK